MTTGHEERFRRLYADEAVARLDRLGHGALLLRDGTRGAGAAEADDPGVRETVEAMLREAHTLKGGAAVVGFPDVRRLAHALEDVLDEVRAGVGDGRPATADVVDGMAVAVDALQAIIDLAVRGEPHTAAVDAAVEALERTGGGGPGSGRP